MIPKEVADWYRRHGLSIRKEDWGPRSETGESAGKQTAERSSARPTDPTESWWWERQDLLWKPRTDEERRAVEALDAFFEPYIRRLNEQDQEVLHLLFNERMTYQEAGEYQRVARQTTWEATQRAVRHLTWAISLDCPDSELTPEQAALCTLDAYWQDRFGQGFPNIGD